MCGATTRSSAVTSPWARAAKPAADHSCTVPFMDSAAVNYAPLSKKPTVAEQDAVRGDARAGMFGRPTEEMVVGAKQDARLLTVVVGGFLALIFAVTTLIGWIGGENDDYVRTGVIAIATVALLSFGVHLFGVGVVGKRNWRRTVQLVAFARANDFDVEPLSKERELPGRLASHSSRYQATWERIGWSQDGQRVEVAVHTDATYGTHVNSFRVRYLAVSLDIELPRMNFGCGRRLPVSGDMRFGTDILADDAALPRRRRPRLICGMAGRERARAFFTDELIHLLTDGCHPANAEVIDGWFLAYYGNGNTLDEDLWRRTIEVVNAVGRSRSALLRLR